MFLRDRGDLQPVQDMLFGYQHALDVHGLDVDVPRFGHTFLHWAHERTGWSMSRGCADALQRHAAGRELDAFFELVDAYARLKPRTVARTKDVAVVQYAPEPFFVHYLFLENGIVSHDAVMRPNGSYRTTRIFAVAQAMLLSRVTPASTRRPSGSRRRGRRSRRGHRA